MRLMRLFCLDHWRPLYGGLVTVLFLGTAGLPAAAQNDARIQGTVSNDKGEYLSGVNVIVKGTGTGTHTDSAGHFSIAARRGDTLIVSIVGYTTRQVAVGSQATINVLLAPGASSLNEVIVVGYDTQKKGTLTSAVSSVTAREIVTTKNENVQNMLTGKIAGLRVVQNSSEPGSFDNSFDIRGLGTPLIVIDGIPRDNIQRLDPNDIESISVLKDASAAVYGVRAANGVVLITTKKGHKGALELNYTGTYGLQVPSRLPHPVSVLDYMILTNEKSMHNVNGGTITFTPADMAPYINGSKQGYNWQDATIKKSAPQTQHNLSATGGSQNVSYYISLGYTNQEGILKSNDLYYNRYNVRSNISAKISKDLSFDLNMNTIMDQKNQPYISPWYVFRSIWYQPPIQAIYANDNPAYLNNVLSGLNGVAHADANVNGYMVLNNKWIQSSAALNYNVPFVKGLSVKGLFSYDFTLNDNKIYMKAYNLYSYNAATNTYTAVPNQTPATIRRESYQYPTNLAQLSLHYTKTLFDDHHVNALLLYEQSTRQADNFYAQRELSIPLDQLLAGNSTNQQGNMGASALYKNVNAAYVGRLTYDFRTKYLAEFSFREDGSSKFATAKQWGFFPFGSLGWRVSEEGFWKNSRQLSFINSFKLRGSYGLTGDDAASTYQFLAGYTYPASGSSTGQPQGSVFDGTFVNGVQSRGLPNPNITWYTAKTLDLGVDLEAWNGMVGVTFDYFVRNRSGLLATQLLSLPDVVGANLPQENLNGDRTKGFDFDVTLKSHIRKFSYNVKGTFGFTRTMNTNRVQARAGNSYLNWLNNTSHRYNNIYWGYGSAGQYQSWADLANSSTYVNRNTVVGDYRYQDWNGDGNISVDDSHPIAFTGTPMITFGLTLGGAWKGFDVSALLQGAALVDVSYFEQLNTPLWAGGGALTQFLDRWHPEDPNANPYDPNTKWVPGYFAYTGTVPYTNTLANIHSAAYVRLKSLEIGYTLPEHLLSRAGLKNVRVFANGYNILTFTGLRYLDPEHPSSQFGYLYPLDKIYSFGLSIKF